MDTGFANVTETGTVESVIANSGVSIELKHIQVVYNRGAKIDKSANPGVYTSNSVINHITNSNPTLVVQGVLYYPPDNTYSTDIDLLDELDKMVTTKGIKILYYGSNTNDGSAGQFRSIVRELGSISSNHTSSTNHDPIAGTVRMIHIKVVGLDVTQSAAGSNVSYTLTCEVTG